MADSVEADLEAPEALTIAREDVLQKKMEDERERRVRPIAFDSCRLYALLAFSAMTVCRYLHRFVWEYERNLCGLLARRYMRDVIKSIPGRGSSSRLSQKNYVHVL